MQAPNRAELQAALQAIQQAAEKVRNYEPELVEQVLTAIAANVETVKGAAGLRADGAARRDRIVQQCGVVEEAAGHAKQYPEQISARAALLDRIGALVRQIREALPLFA
jgi:hypothetical protein